MGTKHIQKAVVQRNSGDVFTYPEAGGQSFKKGDLVYLDEGFVKAACSTTAGVTAPANILGVALVNAAGVTNSPVAVNVLNENSLLEVNFITGATHTSVGATTFTALPTTQMGLVKHSDGKFALSNSVTVNKNAIVVALHPGDPVGTVGGRVIVKIIPKYLQSIVDSTS